MPLKSDVHKILKELGLPEAITDHVENSFHDERPIYHNEEHCYSTALTFYELAKNANLDYHLIKNGFVAALYHDANHQEDPDDRINVSKAIQWYSTTPSEHRVGLTDPLVTWLIRSTLNTLKTFNNHGEALIHDADVLQTVKSSDAAENAEWRARLASELSITVTQESSVAFAQKSLVTIEAKALLELASNLVN